MKHIYIFNSSARGSNYGIGTYVKLLADFLKRTECKVTIVNVVNKDEEFDIYRKGRIRYITIPIPVININNLNYGNFEKSIPFILYPYIDKKERNIFHLNYMETSLLAKSIRLIARGPIVLTVHYTDWSFSLLGNQKKIHNILRNSLDELDMHSQSIKNKLIQETEIIGFCDKIISISKHSYDNLIKIHKADKNKILLINHAIKDSYHESDANISLIREKLKIASDEIILVFVGRLDVVKGIDILLNSFKCVLEQHFNIRLFVVGEGDFNKWLSDSSPVWTKITFTGFLPKKNLQEIYAIADIGIVPSLHEEFGFVAVEMMCNKIPIIVNNTTGLAEIIDDHINGIKVSLNPSKKTSKDLIDKINYLIQNPSIRKIIGENGRKKIKTDYSVKRLKKQMLELYNSL